MIRPPRLTAKRRENLNRLVINAASIIFGALVVGAFLGGPFRVKTFVIGCSLYLLACVLIWWLEP